MLSYQLHFPHSPTMSTNPVLVPVSLVSQFLANEKMASRHWLQCQMECLLDQVFDQLSTKFEDYLASNAITGTAHHTTIDSDHIQHQHRHEPSFQTNSHPQFQANTDHLINTEFPAGQSQNRCQMMHVNVNPNAIHSEALMFGQPQFPHSLSVQNIDDNTAPVDSDKMNIKEEIDDLHEELFTIDQTQYPHLSSVPNSNQDQNDDEVGNNDQPLIEDDDAFRVDSDEIVVKEEINTDYEIISSDQNSQIALPASSNEQSNPNWTSENDEEYDLDGTRFDEQPNGLEYGDIDDDAQMDCDEVEVKEEIDDTNNQLATTELPQNPPLSSVPTSNFEKSNQNNDEEDYEMDGKNDQPPNEHLRNGQDDNNRIEHNEEPSWPRKKPRLETTQPNNRPSRATRQSTRFANHIHTEQHIDKQANFGERQSNEKIEPDEEADESSEVNKQEKQFTTLSLQCLETDCLLTFNSKTQLNAHMNTQHGILLRRCLVKDCKQSFSTQQNLKEHIAQVHPNTTQWHCDKCPKHFPKYSLLYGHNYQMHQLGQYKCAFADCTFVGEHRRKTVDHYRNLHKATIVELTCQHPGCGRIFNNRSNFKKHQRTHLGIKPYRCKWSGCNFASTAQSSALRHIKQVHLTPDQSSNEDDPKNYLEVLRDLFQLPLFSSQ